jgi:hypothetical protein
MVDTYGVSAISIPVKMLLEVAHPNDEPVPIIGKWSGRMIYDRNSAAGSECYDADAQLGVSSTRLGTFILDSITVNPDTGGMYINSNLSKVMAVGVVSGYIKINGQTIDYTIEFFTQGNAEGVWAYDNSECYGDWSFTKD